MWFSLFTSSDLGKQEVVAVSLALEMLRYFRVEGQEQLEGIELYRVLLTSKWVSFRRLVTRWLISDKDWTEMDKA